MPAHARRIAGLTTLTAVAALGLLVPGPATGAAPTCQGEKATLVGSDGADELLGTNKDDVIVALGGDDVVEGRGGADLICGGMGADRLDGGAGPDRLLGGGDRLGDDPAGTFLIGDVLVGGDGDDLLAGGRDTRKVEAHRRPDTISYADSPAGVVVDLGADPAVATGHGTDTIRVYPYFGVDGSPYADTITGSTGDDDLNGLGGDDRIDGLRGADTIFGEDVNADGGGDDDLRGGYGPDVIGSYAGRDVVRGGPQNDFVEAYSDRPAQVSGDAGDDYVAQNLTTGSGSASLGGDGRDHLALYGTLLAGSTPRAELTIDLRTGTTSTSLEPAATGTVGAFEEYRLVGNLRWRFHGSPGRDRVWGITGGPLAAWTYGGDDWVRGTDRDDSVNGGRGIDEVQGQGGDDTCRNVERGGC